MKNLLAKILRSIPGNRKVYPAVMKVWKAVVVPIRRRRLQRCGVRVLDDVHHVMTGIGVRYYVYWGTLLGIIREQGFIRHDDDIDVCFSPQRTSFAELYRALTAAGFKFVHSVQTQDIPLRYTFKKYGVNVDFFREMGPAGNGYVYVPTTRRDPNVRYHGFQCGWKKKRVLDGGEGQEMDFRGIKISIPNHPEAVLESMFGPGWRVPDPNFVSYPVLDILMPDFADRITDPARAL